MKPHHRIFFIQFAVALSLGAFVSRLPDLQLKFSLTEGELGLLLAVMSSGVLCGLTVSVRFIERLGARTTAFVTVFGASLFFALIRLQLFCAWTLSSTASIRALSQLLCLGSRPSVLSWLRRRHTLLSRSQALA